MLKFLSVEKNSRKATDQVTRLARRPASKRDDDRPWDLTGKANVLAGSLVFLTRWGASFPWERAMRPARKTMKPRAGVGGHGDRTFPNAHQERISQGPAGECREPDSRKPRRKHWPTAVEPQPSDRGSPRASSDFVSRRPVIKSRRR